MKKFLGILAIAGVLVACNNSGSTSESADSTKMGDSIPAAVTVPDSTKTDSTMAPVDTTKKAVDTTKAKK
jgi:hypothetical protein